VDKSQMSPSDKSASPIEELNLLQIPHHLTQLG
jgi:hypothetical protein